MKTHVIITSVLIAPAFMLNSCTNETSPKLQKFSKHLQEIVQVMKDVEAGQRDPALGIQIIEALAMEAIRYGQVITDTEQRKDLEEYLETDSGKSEIILINSNIQYISNMMKVTNNKFLYAALSPLIPTFNVWNQIKK